MFGIKRKTPEDMSVTVLLSPLPYPGQLMLTTLIYRSHIRDDDLSKKSKKWFR